MAPWLAALAPAAVQGGLGLLTQRSAKNQREKERRDAEKKAAFAKLVDSLGGQGRNTGRQAGAAPALGNPLLKAAQGLSADPLVQQQIRDLVSNLMSRLPSRQSPIPSMGSPMRGGGGGRSFNLPT